MCNENNIELQNLIFSESEDKFNWVTSSNNPIETVDGVLILKPSSDDSYFKRGLGNIEAANNRISLKCKLKLKRPQNSGQNNFKIWFSIFQSNTLIDKFSIYQDSISGGSYGEAFIDRVYKYENLTGSINLKIEFEQGWENHIELTYLKVNNYNFCENNVRTYFGVEDFFDSSVNSISSLLFINSYKINGQETLTPAYFADNNNPRTDVAVDWKKAIAEIDGNNRISENADSNIFNHFNACSGLDFENTVGNFFGGKTIGSISGVDYGEGMLNFGTDLPTILNLNLEKLKAPFFIDCDYSKSFEIVFDVAVNNRNKNVFDSPNIYREFTIKWDREKCSKAYFYKDKLNKNQKVDVIEDGFLFGLTPNLKTNNSIPCTQSIEYEGEEGYFEYEIDFGTDVGMAGIHFVAFGVPDKFEIEWNGQTFSSGYRGQSSYDDALIAAGVNPSEINTATPGNGGGDLLFSKETAEPTNATIRVYAPLGNTSWQLSGICPYLENFTTVFWARGSQNQVKTGNEAFSYIKKSENLIDVENITWQKYNESSGEWDDIQASFSSAIYTLPNELGSNRFRMRAENVEDSQETVSNFLIYIRF